MCFNYEEGWTLGLSRDLYYVSIFVFPISETFLFWIQIFTPDLQVEVAELQKYSETCRKFTKIWSSPHYKPCLFSLLGAL